MALWNRRTYVIEASWNEAKGVGVYTLECPKGHVWTEEQWQYHKHTHAKRRVYFKLNGKRVAWPKEMNWGKGNAGCVTECPKCRKMAGK